MTDRIYAKQGQFWFTYAFAFVLGVFHIYLAVAYPADVHVLIHVGEMLCLFGLLGMGCLFFTRIPALRFCRQGLVLRLAKLPAPPRNRFLRFLMFIPPIREVLAYVMMLYIIATSRKINRYLGRLPWDSITLVEVQGMKNHQSLLIEGICITPETEQLRHMRFSFGAKQFAESLDLIAQRIREAINDPALCNAFNSWTVI